MSRWPWKRWIALVVFVVVLGAVFIRLGEWQLHRLDWRRGINARVETNQSATPVGYQTLMADGVQEPEEWRRVTLVGTYDAASQLQVKYRSLNSQQGSEVLTVLTTTDGDEVLVDRGFVASGLAGEQTGALPTPPSGQVSVTGYLRTNEQGKDNATVPTGDKTVRLINSRKVSGWLAQPVLDGYVSLISSDPAQPGDLTPMGLPSLDEGPHLSYAIQWFAFSAIAIGGLFILIRGDLKQGKTGPRKGKKGRTEPVDGGVMRTP